MEEIDIKELYSVSSSSVQSGNGISWSEDHKVSQISSTALHIMEVAPNPSITSGEMCLKKSIIKPSDDTPTVNTGINTSRLFYQLEQRDTYRMLLDIKLAPQLPDAKPSEPRFASAQWSPASMFQDHRCMVATLTCTGCLKLHVPHFNSWVEVIDISDLWVQHCKPLWSEQVDEFSKASELFSLLKKRTSQLKISGVIWGDLVKSDQGRYSFMVTISHSGTLAVWKLKCLTDLGTPANDYKPEILTTCETDLYNACVLHWMPWKDQEVSIIAGDIKGNVKIITFSINTLDSTVTLRNISNIWNENDLMKVTCIKSLPHSSLCKNEERILGVTKNSYLLVFLIKQMSVLSYCHQRIGGLPLTGLEVLNNNSFIACSHSGTICKYNIMINESKIYTSSTALKTNLSWQDMACFGIAKNYNNDLWTLCTNLCKMYDHLVVRRPSQIVFFTMNYLEDSSKHLNVISAKIESSKLRFMWESIEIFRMSYLKLLKTQPPKELESFRELENYTTTQLQMELWRARIVVAHFVMTDALVRNPEACAYVTLLEELILCRHACKYICSLVERHKVQPLDERCLRTVGLLRKWLQTWLSHNKANSLMPEKNSEAKNIESVINDTSGTNVADDVEVESVDNAQISATSNLSGFVADVNENVGDNDAASVGSFDDAISTDSNCSSVVSEKTCISKRLQVLQGRVPASFLKPKLSATYMQVTSTLALPIISGSIEKELCPFCEQEVQMDIDWRSGTCSANHRLSRCCLCLSQCHRMPYRLCFVCPAVACLNIDCDLEPFCIFCDSPLTLDDKFRKPGFTPPSEDLEEEQNEKEQQENEDEQKKNEEGKDEKGENAPVKLEKSPEVSEVPMDLDH